MKTVETYTDRQGNSYPVRVKAQDRKPALVKFGKGGHTVEFYPRPMKGGTYSEGSVSESGYDRPEDFFAPSHWWTHDYALVRDAAEFEGVPFVDMREAVTTPEGYAWVFKGPMHSAKLKPGQRDKFVDGSESIALDYVSIDEWCDGWRKVGAIVGHIRNGQFVAD